MMRAFVVCFLALALRANAGDWSSATSTTSPVQKVIELLDSLKGKLSADLEKEAGLMEEFSAFCDDELKEIDYSISTAKGQIEDFKASIEDAEAQVSNLATEIAAASSQIAEKESELAEAQKVREAQNKDFQDNEHEMSLTIDELSRALVAAKKDMSFVQVNAKMSDRKPNTQALISALSKLIEASSIGQKSQQTLKGFLQDAQSAEEGEDLRLNQPQAVVSEYDSHSGGILGTLGDMEEKAQGQLSDLRKGEMEAAFSFQMVKQGLEDEMKLLKQKLSDSTSGKAAALEQMGKEKGELAYTSKTMEADEARLQGQTTECQSKSEEWTRRQKEAGEEQAVIEKAKEILAGGVKAFMQMGSKAASKKVMMKVRKGDDDEDKEEELRDRLAEAFKGMSHKFGSYALSQMVSSARADPFGKIRGMIEDMISKLMTEANEEANAKAFCDEENAKARKSQAEKTALFDKFTARIDEAASKSGILKDAVAQLQKELAEIDAAQAEATKIRSAEHAEYLKASKDFKDSADAVVAAVSVLKSYYEGSFIQVKSEKQPAALGVSEGPEFGGYGKTEGDSAHTIIEVLQVAEEDFTKLLAETEAEEEANSATFKKASDEARIAKATKETEVKDKTSEMKSLEVALNHHNEDRDTVSKELDAVLSYLDKLKPQCESKAMSYEEKKARREAEIEGLKDAMAILEGSSVAVELAQKKTNLRKVKRA